MPAADLMPKLRHVMTEQGMHDYFPLAYYTANIIFTHPQMAVWARQRSGYTPSTMKGVPTESLLLPDAAMATTTELQTDITRSNS